MEYDRFHAFFFPLPAGPLTARRSLTFHCATSRGPLDAPRDKLFRLGLLPATGLRLRCRVSASNCAHHFSEAPQRPLCFKYNNNNNKCTAKNCNFVHHCQRCLGNHPKSSCNALKGDTARAARRQQEEATEIQQSSLTDTEEVCPSAYMFSGHDLR